MSLGRYLKEKIIVIVIFVLVSLFAGVLLSVMGIDMGGIIFITIIYGFAFFALIIMEYLTRFQFYTIIKKNLENLDQKFLISELVEEPHFVEGEVLFQCLKEAGKAMNDKIAKYESASNEYKEFIELWLHEVKTPVASTKLIIENNPSGITESIGEEIESIDRYLEQVLFYSRSNNLEQDYIVREVLLQDMVFSVLRKNAKSFIHNQIVHKKEGLNLIVNTDEKWTEYVIDQVISNAIKYRKESDPLVEIYGVEKKNAVLLKVKDNGIGISEKDIANVFKKSFTGTIGRKYAKSTGLGLYLSKKLCDKMGISISIESRQHLGTTVTITFPKSELSNVTKV